MIDVIGLAIITVAILTCLVALRVILDNRPTTEDDTLTGLSPDARKILGIKR